jgi:hypothetical protein
MTKVRVHSGVSITTGEPFVQLRSDPDSVVLVQLGVHLIGAGAESQNDAATFRFVKAAALAAGKDEEGAAVTASNTVASIRQQRAGV